MSTLFEKIGANRVLIVLGYSGSDDLDIMPALRLMKNVQRVLWIEHVVDPAVPGIIVPLQKIDHLGEDQPASNADMDPDCG